MDSFKHTVLCIDDEVNILNSLKRLLRNEKYQLLTAESAAEGLNILKKHEVHLLISDQRMPEMGGIEFLSKVKNLYPEIIRIILTGYTEVNAITDAINQGHVYKFFIKPWEDKQLKLEILKALEQFDLIQENKKLNKKLIEKNSMLQNFSEIDNKQQQHFFKFNNQILDVLPLPIIVIDKNFSVVFSNKSACLIVIDREFKNPQSQIKFIEKKTEIRNRKILNKIYNIQVIPVTNPDNLNYMILMFYEQNKKKQRNYA
jgi:response regulator RpfG family c-di-GMP phosphodiesterase